MSEILKMPFCVSKQILKIIIKSFNRLEYMTY